MIRFGAGIFLAGLAVLLWTGCGGSPGREAFLSSGCPRCHSANLSGTSLGPSLRNVGAHWDAEGLKAFLKDPDGFRAADDRLRAVAERYPTAMPTFTMSDSTRARIVDYLLSAGE